MKKVILFNISILCALALFSCKQNTKVDSLPSWNNTTTKQNIIEYVESVTDANSDAFIPVKDRIAVFDNDGTLWSEQPMYFQVLYAMDYVKNNFSNHPEWQENATLKAVADGNKEKMAAFGVPQLLDIIAASHGNMSTEEFKMNVSDWLKTAKHPSKGMPFNKMTYKPMTELLQYLRDNEFKTYIVSGGGVEFIRVWAEEAYNIPPEQTIGSSLKAKFVNDASGVYVEKTGELNFLDDKEGKPVMINQVIGKTPVFCGGNSDGDLQMMQYTATSKYKSFNLLVHHTDAEREFAYDKDSHVGRLVEALKQAKANNWTVVDMKNDWNAVYSE